MARAVADRALTGIAHLVLRAFFHRVETSGAAVAPLGRPTLVVASHFDGLVDPVMLMHVFGRLPRFVAKATLWERALVRPLLVLAGMIPIHRPQDRTRGDNSQGFAACSHALANGALVGIFPEGTTHDDPRLRSVRTGAARIALRARRAGVTGLVIVPTGIIFDDKIALRSGVLAVVGDPIELDEVAETLGHGTQVVDETDWRAVRALTALIARRLGQVAPDFADQREAAVLRRAAEVVLNAQHGPDDDITLVEREDLARRMAGSTAGARREVAERLAHYQLDLQLAGLRDSQLARQHAPGHLLVTSALTTLRLALLAPFALLGAVWNVVPYTVVKAVGRAVAKPVSKGTARVLTALVVFPATWFLVIVLDPWDGVVAGMVVLVLAPTFGVVAVGWFESLVRLHRDWRGWVTLTDRRALMPGVLLSRAAVVDAVARATADDRRETR